MFYFRKRTCLSFTIRPIATGRKTWKRTKISASLSQQTIFRDNVHSHLRYAKRPMAVRGGGGGGGLSNGRFP